MGIPSKLRVEGISFILLRKKEKRPQELAWTMRAEHYTRQEDKTWINNKTKETYKITENRVKVPYTGEITNYSWDDGKLTKHIKYGGNYGVMGGGKKNLIIVDFDNEKVQQEVSDKLPATFTVKTGSGLLHKYYFTNKSDSYKIMTKDKDTIADIQGEGKQVVGAGSTHPSGTKYEIVRNDNIAYIDYDELKDLLMVYNETPEKKKKELPKRQYTLTNNFQEDLFNSVSFESLLSEFGVDTSMNPTNCPFHSSKGGKCLGWDDVTAHCFHCEGSWNKMSWIKENKKCNAKEAIEWLADKEGKTDELEESRKQWGIEQNKEINDWNPNVNREEPTKNEDTNSTPHEKRLNFMNLSELKNYEAPEYEWRVDRIIQDKKILILAGSSATYKSWLCLLMSICVASGIKFLDNFNVEKGKVLYIDRENSIPELRNRVRMLMKGLGLEDKEIPIYFLSEQDVKLDNFEDREELFEFIKENQIKMVIADVYRRLISYEENDAGAVSKFFNDGIKTICEQTGTCFIFIHHHKKGRADGDIKELLRGSSDMVNIVDGVLQVSRRDNIITVAQTKNRSGKELEPFEVKIETDEEEYFKLNYMGEKEDESYAKYCVAKMIIWIMEKKFDMFKTKDLTEYEEKYQIKRRMCYSTIKELKKIGVILDKPQRGIYEINRTKLAEVHEVHELHEVHMHKGDSAE